MSERDRRGVLVVAGVVAVVLLAGLGIALKAQHDAGAQSACAPIADPYGKAPAGYAFERPDLKVREQIEKRLNLKPLEQYGLDVTLAWHGKDVSGFLLSFRSADKSEINTIYDAAGRSAQANAGSVHERSFGGTGTKYADGRDGSRTSWALEGCTIVMTAGVSHAEGDVLARAVFSQ